MLLLTYLQKDDKSTKRLVRFNRYEMLDYFKRFDYMKYKYGALLSGIDGMECHENYVPGIYEYFLSYENENHHILYNDIDYNEIKRRIELIYGDSGEAQDYVFLYDFALDHLIDRYLNIPSLDKLFSEHYFEYEWRQHTDFNFKDIDLGFYRDHFIHQIRNCFMIMKMLDVTEDGPVAGAGKDDGRYYYKKIEDVLKSRHNDISKYACAQVEQYRAHVEGVIGSYRDDVRRECGKHRGGRDDDALKAIDGAEGDVEEIVGEMEDNVTEYAWEYLIKGSLIVAALFHDLGYPVAFTYKRSRSISEYISLVMPGDNIGFGRLNDTLESSLLFRTVKRDELERRYNSLDHGALSAFILLLQFYETGAIRELNPIKRGMIELAAVSIYDHTLKYEVSGEGKKSDRAKPSFADNPLSYTLRFVDDLQEWDRTYFEIRSGGDLMYCEKCKMPVNHMWDRLRLNEKFDEIRRKEEKRHKSGGGADPHDEFDALFCGKNEDGDCDGNYDFEYVLDGHMGKPYICGCNAGDYIGDAKTGDEIFGRKFGAGMAGGSQTHHLSLGTYENGTPFSYQKIIYTETSDEVVALCSHEDGKACCAFCVEYDPFRLLCLLSVNQSSLEYRMKELSRLNGQFLRQSGIRFGMRTYMTNNPMMLKMRVLFDFLYEAGYYLNDRAGYRKNAAYFDALWGEDNGLEIGRNDMFDNIDTLVRCLKEANFLAYDYSDEIPTSKPAVTFQKKVSDEMVDAVFRRVAKYTEFVVPRLMGGKGDGCFDVFARNLCSTVKAYLSLMQTALKLDGGDRHGWEDYIGGFDALRGTAGTGGTYGKACGIVLDDLIRQLYCQRFEKAGMDEYYGEAEGDGTLGYAVKILFDKKYYNPLITRTTKGLNHDENHDLYKFTFFDIYSDMYLFKEMSRFSNDNRRRRMKEHAGFRDGSGS